MDNAEVAEVLQEIGTLLEIQGENPFKCRAYYNAARTIETLAENISRLVEEKRLGEIEGIGEALQTKITTLVETSHLPYLDELKASIPAGLPDLLKIPGLGPKKVKAFHLELKISSLEELENACKDGRIAQLKGFGEKTAQNILDGIEQIKSFQGQHLYSDAIDRAEEIASLLRQHPDVIRVSVAGSLRRSKEVIKDIDILASAKDSTDIMNAFCSMDGATKVLSHGTTKSSVLLEGGLQCDLRVVQDSQYPYALHHFTGSKEHNVAMRQLAISKRMKMSEWGLFQRPALEDEGDGNLIPCTDEADIFDQLGLEFIPPELRENLGEIEAAKEHHLPKLVEWSQLRGCFHNHTTETDGRSTFDEMVQCAEDLGFEYFGLSDHSRSSTWVNGLSIERLLKQVEQIRKHNTKGGDCHIFTGVECDILKDGSLDYPDEILAQLDYVVASVHSITGMTEDEMTRRIIRAIENPHVTMLGHMTGRLLLKRDAYPVNVQKIITAAAKTGTWIELNSNPLRLDMDWRHWKTAKEKGVKCVINPDAHHYSQIGYVRLGINIARKGWLEKKDVINTLPFVEIKKALLDKRKKMNR